MNVDVSSRKLPFGAEIRPGGGIDFRVWAPKRQRVEVVIQAGPAAGREFPLQRDEMGFFAGRCLEATAGSRYRMRLDADATLYPDPASRFQPDGPHGPSEVVDAEAFPWTDRAWPGVHLRGQVIYEMHLGTFTRAGTWQAAMQELPELARLGVTVLEIMPIADFAGRFGWGYDGVNLFAPCRLYGTPDDARRFIDSAHQLGLGVILDVVYNHLGPDGNYLGQFADDYFTDRYKTDWGKAINYDGPNSEPVREYFLANAGYWIEEFHFDGLRLDATQNIYDESADSILSAISRRVRRAAGGRSTIIVTENEPQHVKMVRPLDRGGHGFDAMWNDDFHHSARVALTGRAEAYLGDYRGSPQEFISVAKRGFLYQGQRYRWQEQPRGTPTTGVAPAAFVNFLENHDQVANSAQGLRVSQLSSPGRLRALTALCLLGPGTPMLFQGQEFGCTSPFLYFADHEPNLARLVHAGRKEFLAQFPSIAQPAVQERIDDPASAATFEKSKLDFAQRQTNAKTYVFHHDLLQLRRSDPVFKAQRPSGVDGAVLGPDAFVLRFFGATAGNRLLLVNLGQDLVLAPAPEPLLAPPEGTAWQMLWTSEDPRYGGDGAFAADADDGWHVPGGCAVVMRPQNEI